MSSASSHLRRMLADPGLLHLPGIYDGLSAHLVRRAGARAAYATGAGIAASGFGLPDIGLVTATEMVERVGVLTRACELPVLADADTGYGNPLHVVRTVQAYERAGVAGLHLEDQAFPKRCGHLADKVLVDTDEFRRKLAAALECRAEGAEGVVVVARTDARGPLGIDEALRRARAYAAEGPDALFVEAPQSLDEIEQVAEVGRDVGLPLLFNRVPGGLTPDVDDAELERLGFAAVIAPGALLAPAAAALATAAHDAVCDATRDAVRGDAPTPAPAGPAGLFEVVGLSEWADLDHRHREGAMPWA